MEKELQRKIDFKTKPTGSLGQLEEIAKQIGIIQKTLSPRIANPTMLVFAADHGLSEEKISPYPKDVTWQMVMNFVAGGAAINVFCKQNNVNLKVIDAGVDYDFPSDLPVINAKIDCGTKNLMHQPAMSKEQCKEAMKKGSELVRAEVDAGCNTIGFGEMGIGNTSASSLLMHKFLNIPIEDCVGAGAGMNGEGLSHKQKVLMKVAGKYNPSSPIDVIATFGGFEIAMMAGAFIEACNNNMVILVDGFIATTALLCAYQLEPEVIKFCIFCHNSQEQGHKKLLEFFNAKPILNLGLRLGEGTGAALAVPIIKSAVNFLNEMASFEDAGVSNKD